MTKCIMMKINVFKEIIVLLLVVSSCATPGHHQGEPISITTTGKSQCFIVTSQNQLLKGPGAAGKIGDIRIQNDRVVFIIASIEHKLGYVETGGNIIDAAGRYNEYDGLGLLFPQFAHTFPRQAFYADQEIVNDGSDGQPAHIRVWGHDSGEIGIKIVTDYILRPQAAYIEITTTLENNNNYPIYEFALGDVLVWKRVKPFINGQPPTHDHEMVHAPFITANSDDISYIYSTKREFFNVRQAFMWSDTHVKSVHLLPREPKSYSRFLYVKPSQSVSLMKFLQKNDRAGSKDLIWVQGSITIPAGYQKQGVQIDCLSESGLILGRGFTDDHGDYAFPVAGNACVISAHHKQLGDEVSTIKQLHMHEENIFDPVQFMEPAQLTISVSDQDGKPIPAKIIFTALDGDNPYFGEMYEVPSGNQVCHLPQEMKKAIVLPAGKYTIEVQRGLAYSKAIKQVDLQAGNNKSLVFRLHKQINVPGYKACDFNQYSSVAFDSPLNISERIEANACEGVELLSIAETGKPKDVQKVITHLNLDKWVKAIPTQKVKNYNIGHFQLFFNSTVGGNFSLQPDSLRGAHELLSELQDKQNFLVEVLHPRAGYAGYFDRMQWVEPEHIPTELSTEFHLLEVMSGKNMWQWEQSLLDWFALLNKGHKITALAGSNSQVWFGNEPGYPRTYLQLNGNTTSQQNVFSALKKHKAIISNGPLVEFQLEGKDIGALVQIPSRFPDCHVKIHHADWMVIDKIQVIGNGKILREISLDTGSLTKQNIVDRQFRIPLVRDTWVLVKVTGKTVDKRPLVAVTNPLWVDIDNDGMFQTIEE